MCGGWDSRGKKALILHLGQNMAISPRNRVLAQDRYVILKMRSVDFIQGLLAVMFLVTSLLTQYVKKATKTSLSEFNIYFLFALNQQYGYPKYQISKHIMVGHIDNTQH